MAKTEPFDLYSEEYDNWFKRNKEKYEAELRAIKDFIPSKGNGLEIGVGSGKFAYPLGIKIGIEPSDKLAEKSRALEIKVIKGVAENLPVADSSFDFVLMVTTICFVDDIEKSFREAFRVLKKEGFIVVGFVDRESELGKEYMLRKNKSRFYKAAYFFPTGEVLNYLNNAGFGAFQIKQTIFPGTATQHIENGFGKGSFVVIKASK
jgi:ubiquinone/menaquinone biosynthesis C-methylase UbiE